jgi:hypothetical protein
MKSALSIVAVLVLAPAAGAQTNCAAFDKIVAAAPGGFPSLLKTPRQEGATSQSTTVLPGYKSCTIAPSPPRVMLFCVREVSARELPGVWSAANAEARSCLPGWSYDSITVPEDPNFVSTATVEFVQPGEHPAMEFNLATFDQKVGNKTTHFMSSSFFWGVSKIP